MERLGAEVIDMNRLPEVEGGYGADIVLDCMRSPQAILEGMRTVRRGGHYAIVVKLLRWGKSR